MSIEGSDAVTMFEQKDILDLPAHTDYFAGSDAAIAPEEPEGGWDDIDDTPDEDNWPVSNQVAEPVGPAIGTTAEVVGAAALVDSGVEKPQAMERIKRQVEVLGTIGTDHPLAEIPRWLFPGQKYPTHAERGSPQYAEKVAEATRELGDDLLGTTIQALCYSREDPVGHGRERLDCLQRVWERYGERYGVPRLLVESAVVLASDVKVALGPVLGGVVLDDVRALQREYPRLGQTGVMPYLRPLYDALHTSVKRWTADSGVEAASVEAVAKPFTRMWFGYSRHRHPDALADLDMAEIVFGEFCSTVLTLNAAGLSLDQAGKLACTGDLGSILARIEDSTAESILPPRAVIARRLKLDAGAREPTKDREPKHVPPSFDEAKSQTLERLGRNERITDGIIRQALKYRDWGAAIDRYLENHDTLTSRYARQPEVTPRVIRRFAMQLNADKNIQEYVAKYAVLAARFAYDDDYSEEVLRELALTYSRKNLFQEAAAWKERYLTVCSTAMEEDMPSKESIGVALVGHASPDIGTRLRYARYLDRLRRPRDISLQRLLDERTGSDRGRGRKNMEEVVRDPRELSAEDMVIAAQDRQEKIGVINHLLSGLNDLERQALLLSQGFETGTSKEELTRRLGEDVDEYVRDVIIPRLREAASRRMAS